MSVTLEAIFENGSFRPVKPLDFPERERVRLTIDSIDSAQSANDDSTSQQDSETAIPSEEDEEERPWRGIFIVEVPYKPLVLPDRTDSTWMQITTPEIHITLDPRYFDEHED